MGKTMVTTVFSTQSKLDLRSLTTFGVNSKPNSKNPIGYFGTGLKYAFAVLARESIDVKIVIANKPYTLAVVAETFREKEFEFLYLVDGGGKRKKLPFTTELGKNWKLWQAFRELYTNTIDENGSIAKGVDDTTYIGRGTYTIVAGEAFAEVFDQRFTHTFIREGLGLTGGGVQILNRPSDAIYYRGVRVMELPKGTPSLLTYNILDPIKLTEDRTAECQWAVQYAIVNALCGHKDIEILNVALHAKKGSYEHSFDFSHCWQAKSPEYIYVGWSGSNMSARKHIRNSDEKWIAAQGGKHFTERLAFCIEDDDWRTFTDIAQENADELRKVLLSFKPASFEPEAEMITPSQPLLLTDETAPNDFGSEEDWLCPRCEEAYGVDFPGQECPACLEEE
jgi:hypothetical protein